ncbi:MAG: delta-60 repeat domain-containing protein [Saprospirales bacterium]|nr:delta-60 repeat domain-containing protein [Saprospirales bacterium]
MLFCLLGCFSFSQDGELDKSYGNDGLVLLPMGTTNTYAYDAALQSDGKLIAVGTYENSAGEDDVFVMRIKTNGSLDMSFQGYGFHAYDISGSDFENAYAVWLVGNKILVGGNSGSNGFVMRLNSDGSMDETFGTNGVKGINLLNNVQDIKIVPVLSSYEIFLAGSFPDDFNSRPGIVKLSENGTVAASFGVNGRATLGVFRKGIFLICISLHLEG